MSRMTGNEMGNMLSDFVNSSFASERNELASVIVSDHRSLQEDSFLMFLKCIEVWADNYDSGYYDERNKYTCMASSVMINALKDKGLL